MLVDSKLASMYLTEALKAANRELADPRLANGPGIVLAVILLMAGAVRDVIKTSKVTRPHLLTGHEGTPTRPRDFQNSHARSLCPHQIPTASYEDRRL